MATITINGRRVKVDDSFLSLTKEQQNATVDEIAASFTTPGNTGADPSQAFQDATANASAMTLKGKVGELPSRQDNRSVVDKLMDATGATVNGLVNGIPILGPAAQNVTDAIGGTIAQISTGDFGPILTPEKHANSTAYDDYVNRQRAVRAGYAERAPLASLSGNVVSALGSYGGLANVPGMAVALGLKAAPGATGVGGLLGQAGRAFTSNQIIGTVDSMARGDNLPDAFNNNLIGSTVAGGLPIAGAGIRAAGRFVGDKVVRPLAALANRENEATTRIAGAMGQDVASGVPRMSAADEAIAAKAGADVVNADRFGEAIRTLARTASNVNPQADAVFKNVTEQRFLTQGGRAVNYLKTLMGGATDDIALQDRLLAAAKVTNKANYDAARSAPGAKAIFTPKIRQLLSSDILKTAAREADTVGSDYAALTGSPAVKNPFTFDESGNLLGLRKLPGGGNALPNLEFWDVVQRNLRGVAEKAKRAGDMELASRAGQLRSELLNELDSAVPQFKKARQGAAGFFGADDAIEAGKKAWTSTKSTPEIDRAVAAMSKAEKDAFSVGFSSELIDAINASKDRVNVINSIFGSQSARDRIRIALGPQRARELEAYVKVEQTLHLLKDAVSGNSSTTKQLIAAGVLGGGGGMMLSGGDPTQALGWAGIAAAGRRGLQMLGKRVDDQVMKIVAEALASTDPAKMQRAIQNATLSKAHMDAIDAIMTGLQTTARGVMSGSAASGPVDLGVIAGGNPALAGSGL